MILKNKVFITVQLTSLVFLNFVFAADQAVMVNNQLTPVVAVEQTDTNSKAVNNLPVKSFEEKGPLQPPSMLMAIPSGFTVAKSNSNFAFKLSGGGTERPVLNIMDLVSGKEFKINTSRTYSDYGPAGQTFHSYDISPDGRFLIFGEADEAHIRSMIDPTKPEINFFSIKFGLESLSLERNQYDINNPTLVITGESYRLSGLRDQIRVSLGSVKIDSKGNITHLELNKKFESLGINYAVVESSKIVTDRSYDGKGNLISRQDSEEGSYSDGETFNSVSKYTYQLLAGDSLPIVATGVTAYYRDKILNSESFFRQYKKDGLLIGESRESFYIDGKLAQKIETVTSDSKEVSRSTSSYQNGLLTEIHFVKYFEIKDVFGTERESLVKYTNGKPSSSTHSYYSIKAGLTRKIETVFYADGKTIKTSVDYRYSYLSDGTQYVSARYLRWYSPAGALTRYTAFLMYSNGKIRVSDDYNYLLKKHYHVEYSSAGKITNSYTKNI